MNVRLSSVLGAFAVLLGLAMVYVRSLAGAISPQWAMLVLIGVLAVIQGLRIAQSRRRTELRETETDDPEKRYEAPTPGDDVQESLALARRWSRAGRTTRSKLRDRLHEAAVTAVVDEFGCSRAEAARRVSEGDWTADPVAAAFLGDEVTLSARQRGRLLVDARSPFGQYGTSFARTVRAVASLTAVDRSAAETEVTD